MNSKLKQKLPEVNYTRNYQADHLTPILFVGNSRWLQDIELLLEDEWKAVTMSHEKADLADSIKTKAPKLCVIETNPYGDSELRLIESILPKNTVKFVISQEGQPELAWRRLQRDLVPHGVGSLLLPKDPKAAIATLSEVLRDLVSLANAQPNEDVEHLRAAFQGFACAASNVTHINQALDLTTLNTIYKKLLSKFAIGFEQLQAATILSETYPLYTKLKGSAGELSDLYRKQERLLAETTALKLLDLAAKWAREVSVSGVPSQSKWEEWVKNAGFGIQARRRITEDYSELAQHFAHSARKTSAA